MEMLYFLSGSLLFDEEEVKGGGGGMGAAMGEWGAVRLDVDFGEDMELED